MTLKLPPSGRRPIPIGKEMPARGRDSLIGKSPAAQIVPPGIFYPSKHRSFFRRALNLQQLQGVLTGGGEGHASLVGKSLVGRVVKV